MKKNRSLWNFLGLNSISGKIIWGFILIYIFFIINSTISYLTVSQGTNRVTEFTRIVNPSIDKVDAFRLMVTQSQLYTLSWVHEKTEIRPEDKDALNQLHINFPRFKDQLVKLKKDWTEADLDQKMDSIFTDFEELIAYQKQIKEKLAAPEDYFDDISLLEAEYLLNNQVLPRADAILQKLDYVSEQKKKERETTEAQLLEQFEGQIRVNFLMGAFLIVVGFLVSWWTRRQIVGPIKYINSVFEKLGTGELPEDKHFKFSQDEIGEMAESADKLVFSLKETSRFAENIGKGNYQADYSPLSEKDVLGNALLEMRDNLATVAEEDQRRSWSTEGLVMFSELLKQHNNEIEKLADDIISNLVKYVKAHQGGLFIVEQYEPGNNGQAQNGESNFLRLASCYAWDKKKFIDQKIYPGDGLAGQAWQEQATIYLNEVPQDYGNIPDDNPRHPKDYQKISSGLGEAFPHSVLIVPLKLNDEVFGVVELASFREFEPFEIEFIEKIAESIASTIATVRINERTKRLLDESTLMTEQMKSQEEEMRQNMEELQATQEHIEKSQREVRAKEELFNYSTLIVETDIRFIIKSNNELTEAKLGYEPDELKDIPLDLIFQDLKKPQDAKHRLKQGNRWSDFIYLKSKKEAKVFVKANASPITDERGDVIKYLFIFDDISQARS